MDITVIIPSYKPKEYLFACLDSVINQTLDISNYEVLVILNGCNEPYYSTINHYLESIDTFCPTVKVYQIDEAGVSNARNFGLDKAQGEYIAFIDDDDYVSPFYLEELLRISAPGVVGISSTMAFNGDTQYEYHLSYVFDKLSDNGRIPYFKAKSYFSGPCMKLIHCSVIRDRRFDRQLKNGEDTLFMFEISDSLSDVMFTSKKAIYFRRIRPDSAVTKKRSFSDISNSNLYQIKRYCKIFFSSPSNYSFSFFVTRVGGCLFFMLKSLFRL